MRRRLHPSQGGASFAARREGVCCAQPAHVSRFCTTRLYLFQNAWAEALIEKHLIGFPVLSHPTASVIVTHFALPAYRGRVTHFALPTDSGCTTHFALPAN